MSCCCCKLPEVEKTCWSWSLEGGCKVVASLYLIEGVILSVNTLSYFPEIHYLYTRDSRVSLSPDGNLTADGNLTEDYDVNANADIYRESHYYALVILLSIFAFIYLLQSVSSLFLLIGLTVKEKSAFIRGFIIANHIFIAEDVLECIMYMLMYMGKPTYYDDMPADKHVMSSIWEEKSAFIRGFIIANHIFIAEDVLEFIMYVLMFVGKESYDNMPADVHDMFSIWDVVLAFGPIPFSIYSQILVSSHYKQVRRAITGPVQAASETEEGFVNKYLRF
ncbi:hypothetical protein WDU94_014237 [Cyamophila willieti]